MGNEKKIRILLVDDHPLIRRGIRQTIEKEDDMLVCGEASTAEEAIRLINAKNPSLAVVDITLSGSTNGLDLIRAVKERFPGTRTVVLTMHDEKICLEEALRAGAMGYLRKDTDADNLVEAVRKVCRGGHFVSESASEWLISRVRHPGGSGAGPDALSAREREVFGLLAEGLTGVEVSRSLGVNVHTVYSYKRRIMKKLGIGSSAELYRYAIRHRSPDPA